MQSESTPVLDVDLVVVGAGPAGSPAVLCRIRRQRARLLRSRTRGSRRAGRGHRRRRRQRTGLAQTLDGIARSVTLVHRRATFRAQRSTVDKLLAAPGVEVLVDHQVVDSSGSPDLRSICVQHAAGQRRWLDCQTVVAALGFVANLGPLADILVDSRMATTAPGVFAAGDITEYPGKARLIAVGFGEAATAVNNAAALIDPEAPLFPGHSIDHLA